LAETVRGLGRFSAIRQKRSLSPQLLTIRFNSSSRITSQTHRKGRKTMTTGTLIGMPAMAQQASEQERNKQNNLDLLPPNLRTEFNAVIDRQCSALYGNVLKMAGRSLE
jgi:hypothetical protein